MALDGVLASGLSAVLTNSAALRVTSSNIANVNTPGYVRRVAQMQTLAPGGQLSGVTIAQIQRAVSNYLDKEVLSAKSSAARYSVQSSMMNQLNAALGQPGDNTSIGSRIDALYAALGQASLDPGTLATRLGTLTTFDSMARSVSDLANATAALRTNADQQISDSVNQANSLIKQLFDLNRPIQQATVNGDTASGLLDQRDQLLQQLSELMDIRTVQQDSGGRMFVSTSDGVQLIGDNYAQLTYSPSAGPSFAPITLQTVNALTNQPIGNPLNLDSHIANGQLRGLLDLRDVTLVGIGLELGSLTQSLSQAFNKVHNQGASVPPPTDMTGRQTGLLDTDSLNFSGVTSIGIADTNGVLQNNITVDFDAGMISVDGVPTAAIGGTVGSFVTALNAALGANGTALFSDGVLSLSATGGNGFVIADDAATPTSRAGVGFSQYFGLNDIFKVAGNGIPTTGLSSADLHGFAPGGEISLFLKGPQGQRVNAVTVSVTGTTIGDMVTALNTSFAGTATFALDANGQLQMTPVPNYSGYTLEVTTDTTARGNTGQSFSSLFGLGTGQSLVRAQSFSLADSMVDAPDRLDFAKASLDVFTPAGTTIVTAGDNRGLLALQDLINQKQNFLAVGSLPARSITFSDYAAAFYQDVSSRANAIDAAKTAQETRLQLAQQNQSASEGVNLDEELARMLTLQQAYNAGARLIAVSKELYDELLKAVGG